jgi:hypothetical protein
MSPQYRSHAVASVLCQASGSSVTHLISRLEPMKVLASFGTGASKSELFGTFGWIVRLISRPILLYCRLLRPIDSANRLLCSQLLYRGAKCLIIQAEPSSILS